MPTTTPAKTQRKRPKTAPKRLPPVVQEDTTPTLAAPTAARQDLSLFWGAVRYETQIERNAE